MIHGSLGFSAIAFRHVASSFPHVKTQMQASPLSGVAPGREVLCFSVWWLPHYRRGRSSVGRLFLSLPMSLWARSAFNLFLLKLVSVNTVLCATEPVKSGVKRYYTFDPEQTKYVYCEGLIREKEKLLTYWWDLRHPSKLSQTGWTALSLLHGVSRVRPPWDKTSMAPPLILSFISCQQTLPWFCRWDGTSSHEASTTDSGGAGGK